MKKPVQSETKREIVPQEQHEPQDQLEQQASQVSEQSKIPEMSRPSQAPDAPGTSQEMQDTEAPKGGSDAGEAASSQEAAAPQVTRPKKRKRKMEPVSEEEIMPHPSYWPLALAIAVVIMLLGAIAQPIVMVVGVILVIGSIIGWSVERR
jgi:hypothetical protein